MNTQARRLREKDLREIERKDATLSKLIRDFKRKKTCADDIYDLTPARIVEELNANSRSASSKRLMRFIELFARARDLNDSFRLFFESHDEMTDFLLRSPSTAKYVDERSTFTGLRFEGSPELQALNEKLNEVLRQLNTLLRGYKWFPVVRHLGFETSQFEITEGWGAKAGDRSGGLEYFYIWWLCKFENGRWIESFRRCKSCDEWFFAWAMHQAFCGDACRKRHASVSPEFKMRRARYMREYRRKEANRDKRAQSLARRVK
jgi:hypothetical protein